MLSRRTGWMVTLSALGILGLVAVGGGWALQTDAPSEEPTSDVEDARGRSSAVSEPSEGIANVVVKTAGGLSSGENKVVGPNGEVVGSIIIIREGDGSPASAGDALAGPAKVSGPSADGLRRVVGTTAVNERDAFAGPTPPRGGIIASLPAGADYVPSTGMVIYGVGNLQLAGKYDPELAKMMKEMAKLVEADRKMEQEIQSLVTHYRKETDAETRAVDRELLESLTAEHFDLRQQQRRLQIAQMEAELAKIRAAMKKRDEAKELIVARRVSQLLGEQDELAFPPGAAQGLTTRRPEPPNVAEGEITNFRPPAPGGLSGKVLDPQGRPLAGALWAGRTHMGQFVLRPLASDNFLVEEYKLQQPRRLLFWHQERKLAGSIILRGPQKEPITVRLQPQGVLTGRVVDGVDRPLARLSLCSPIMSAHHDSTNYAALPEANYTTDEDGRFRIEGLAPGVKYNVGVRPCAATGGDFGQVVFYAAVKSGETKDLGDLPLIPLDIPLKPPVSPLEPSDVPR